MVPRRCSAWASSSRARSSALSPPPAAPSSRASGDSAFRRAAVAESIPAPAAPLEAGAAGGLGLLGAPPPPGRGPLVWGKEGRGVGREGGGGRGGAPAP